MSETELSSDLVASSDDSPRETPKLRPEIMGPALLAAAAVLLVLLVASEAEVDPGMRLAQFQASMAFVQP